MRKDPQEMRNVYNDPDYQNIVKNLKAQLKQMREDLNETDTDYPKLQKIIEEYWDQ